MKKKNAVERNQAAGRVEFARCVPGLFLALLLGLGLTGLAVAKDDHLKTEANVMVEVTMTANQTYADPFNDVTLDVVFTDPKGREFRVPAFWAGTNVWKARYASPVVGKHTFRSECSQPQDQGLQGATGDVEVTPYTGKNPLYTHGPLKLSANRRYLEYNDGQPFFWLGDTWWLGLSARLHWPEDVQTLARDRKEKGFNVIQLVAGLFPDMHPFAPHGANEGGFPWTTNYSSIRPEYFAAADERLFYLVDQGFTPCIVGAWGYFMQWMGIGKSEAHWRYLIGRYGALPVVWCAAGEANLDWYLTPGFPHDDRGQVKKWTEVTRYLRATDPFHRLITIHPTGLGRLSARHTMDDLSLIDIDMLQTPHGQRDAVAPTVNTMRASYADQPVLPIINGEAAFEMLGDTLPTQWTRRMFWLCMMNGAAGHTYGANGIWQVNRKGDPHGPSPTAGSPPNGYGAIPWDEAMNLPGSTQVAFGAKLFQQYPWYKFTPHPEWAAFTAGESTLNLDGVNWIWFSEGNPQLNAPSAKRFFRAAFVLPKTKTIQRAQLRISADNQFSARLNGDLVGSGSDWRTGKQFDDIADKLTRGTNILAIEAENIADSAANPAGLIARLEILFADGETLRLVSDGEWRSAKSAAAGWDQNDFDDSLWPRALVIGKHGDAPWGSVNQSINNGVYGPQSAGIPGGVRIIYVPESDPIIVRELGKNAMFVASYFNPVTGVTTAIGDIKSDDAGTWPCPPLAGASPDWVVVLEPRTK